MKVNIRLIGFNYRVEIVKSRFMRKDVLIYEFSDIFLDMSEVVAFVGSDRYKDELMRAGINYNNVKY